MIIHFPAYRRYTQARIKGNDAILALLLGARISRHGLRQSEAEQFLPDLFINIPDINRLNRTVSDSVILLEDSEKHLAYMAIPYILAVHSSFLVDLAKLLRANGHEPRNLDALIDLNKLSVEQGHEYLQDCLNASLEETWLSLFDLVRKVRNRIIHYAGEPGSRLGTTYNELSKEARREWKRLSGHEFTEVLSAESLKLSEGDIGAVFAVSLRIAEELNGLIGRTLSREAWASIVVEDFKSRHPSSFNDKNQRIKKLVGYAESHYKSVELSAEDIEAALNTQTSF